MSLISIFTPTHNPQFLLETYASIKDQPYDEWVIYPNMGCAASSIQEEIKADPRTVIVESPDGLWPPHNKMTKPGIGAVKKFICSKCSGDILVELDHDDLLVNDAIVKIREVFEDPEVVFAYSNCAEFNDPGYGIRMYGAATPETNYDPVNGWRYRDVYYEGHLLKEAISPELTPDHASLILWAPNHFRAFRKDAYDQVGGHNENMTICDDQDLMCRLYSQGKFAHIDECCYLYRVHGENSWLKHNADIQTTMVDVQKHYIRSMIETWALQQCLPMIDICGGFNSPDGYLSLDLRAGDVCCNLNDRWPLEDSSVGVVRAFDAIEHLKDPIHTMSEIHRVLVPGGYTVIEVPSTDGRGAWQDPTHCCYAEDTEVLTSEGFKFFNDLNGDEIVYAYDKDTETAVLQPISKIHKYDYNGRMVHFKGRALDCLVTPNHKMIVGSSDDKTPFRFMTAEETLNKKAALRIPSNTVFDGDYPEYFEIPGSRLSFARNPKKGFVNDTVRLPIKPFMAFMGWYISEGYVSRKNTEEHGGRFNFYRIGISQSEKAKPDHFEQIGECIRALGYVPFKNANGWYFNDKAFANWLARLGHSHEKFIPIQIKQMHPDLLEIFLETAMLGDGTYQGTFGTYATTSTCLASDMQEIAVRCNYRSTIGLEKRIGKQVFVNPDYRAKFDMNLVYISKTRERYITNRSLIDYKGKVYCVTIPEFNVILTRRNGKTIWAGNSFWNQNSFWYYTRQEQAQYIHNDSIRFKPIVLETHFPNDWCQNNNIPYVRADLVCLKDGLRPMGPIEI